MKGLKRAVLLLAVCTLVGCGHGHDHGGDGHGGEHGHEAAAEEQGHSDAHGNGTPDEKHAHQDEFGGLDDLFEDESPGVAISFSSEQQRQVDFATARAELRRMRSSLAVTGILKAAAGGEANVVAPISGYLAPSQVPFPRFGDRVKAGQTLLRIVPRIGGEADPASLELAVNRSRSNHQLAARELKRLGELLEQGAVPERRVSEARKEEQVARAELDAAERRLKQYRTHPENNTEATAITVPTPVDGRLDGVYVTPGAYLQEGAPLFHVVNTDRLRLEARIAEADIGRLINPRGAWFEVDGFDRPFEIDLDKGDRMVALGSVVDPRSRTVPLVFEFPNAGNKLRIGMFVRAHVVVGETRETIAIPVDAIEERAGQAVAYVQTGVESFERRLLTLGVRDGSFVEVLSGINADEQVVTKGSYLVQLAASGPQEAGHGHAH